RLLVRDGDAVLDVDDHLVRRERRGLLEHAQARRRHGQARATGPRSHVRKLTNSLHRRNGPLTGCLYLRCHGNEEPAMRWIATVTGALTVLVLVLPVHP